MKSLIFLFLVTLFVLSNTAQAKDPCNEIMTAFFKRAKSIKAGSAVTKKAKKLDKILASAQKYSIDEASHRKIQETLEGVEKLETLKFYNSYFQYMDSLKPKQEMIAAADLAMVGGDESSTKFLKKYRKIQKSIGKEKDKITKSINKKVAKENPGRTSAELDKIAQKEIKKYMKGYEKLSYGCRSTKMTPERKMAAATFKKFTIGIGIASTVAGYSYNNRDKPKDGQWFGKLGYELTWGVITGYLASKIISNPENGPVNIALKKYFLARGNGLIDMGLYGWMFGASNEDAEQRLADLKNSPEKRKQLLELKKYLEDKKVFAKVKDSIIENVKKLGLPIKPPVEIHDIDWENLSDEDLEREDVQDVVMAAILSQIYDENKGKVFNTGHIGADRYSFHASYGLIMMPKDTFISLYIYNVLCMGQMNPRQALFKALGIYTLNRVVFDQMYYFARRESINQ